MPSTEEDILLQLLPQIKGKLDYKLLKPHLKLSCSLTDEECQLLFECSQSTSGSNGAHVMLVELLRQKGPHCCARMLLNALKQSQKNSHSKSSHHSEVIALLQAELKSTSMRPQHLSKGGCSGQADSNVSAQESDSLNYFPSAVPESPSSRNPPLASKPSQPQKPTLNPLQCNHQPSSVEAKNSEMAVIISIGPSGEPAPLIRYEFYKTSMQSMEASYELIMKSKLIQSNFSKLVLDVCSLLQDSPMVFLEKLQMWLSFQRCSKAAHSLQVFNPDSDTLMAKTIPSLISSLRCYTSWYNYELIADIARQFCGDRGLALVEAYELDLKYFLQTLIFHCPPVFPDSTDMPQLESLELKVGWDLSTSFLEGIAIFKHTLCQLCDLDPRFVVIKRVSNSEFQIACGIPKSATGKINETMKSKPNLFTQNNINAVRLSGSETDFKPKDDISISTLRSVSLKVASPQYSGNGALIEPDDRHITATATAGDCRSNTSANEISDNVISRIDRDKKALSLGTTLPCDSDDMTSPSLLSEINQTLKTSRLLSYGSVTLPPSGAVGHADSRPLSDKDDSESMDEVFGKKTSDSIDMLSIVHANSIKKTVSFLWRMLGRARPHCHANIFVVCIQAVDKTNGNSIEVRKGQHLKALYRVSDKVFVETSSLKQGFIPYTSFRISRKHYGSQSKLLQLAYLQLYPQTPDGIDIQPVEQIPSIKMVALKNYFPATKEELHAQSNQVFTVLYCDAMWVYTVSGSSGGLLPRSVCALTQESQTIFKRWQTISQFQSDFIMKSSEPCPAILDERPVVLPVAQQKSVNSRVGKVFTINQNFVPSSPTSSTRNFTIRKGLRVKVIKENGQHICVTTRTGFSFWIPHTHVRPARKSSLGDFTK